MQFEMGPHRMPDTSRVFTWKMELVREGKWVGGVGGGGEKWEAFQAEAEAKGIWERTLCPKAAASSSFWLEPIVVVGVPGKVETGSQGEGTIMACQSIFIVAHASSLKSLPAPAEWVMDHRSLSPPLSPVIGPKVGTWFKLANPGFFSWGFVFRTWGLNSVVVVCSNGGNCEKPWLGQTNLASM